jgi:hypothetical protein
MQNTPYSSEFLMKLEVSRQIMLNFMKIRPVRAEFYADGQTARQADARDRQTDRET